MIRSMINVDLTCADFEVDSTQIAAFIAQAYSGCYQNITLENIKDIVHRHCLHVDLENVNVANIERQYIDMYSLFLAADDMLQWTPRRDVHILWDQIQNILKFEDKFDDKCMMSSFYCEIELYWRPVAKCSQIYVDFVQYILGYEVCAADIHGNIIYFNENDVTDMHVIPVEQITADSRWNDFKRTRESFDKRRV